MAKTFLWILILMLPVSAGIAPAFAQEKAYSIKPDAEMKDILVEYTGKRVALRLASGEEIEGTVTTVGKSLVHVSRLTGKEFYDSVVSIDRISAVRMKVRER